MSWENKGGDGGGGPWGRGGGGAGGGPRPPDIEDFIRKGQDRFKGFLPGAAEPVRRLRARTGAGWPEFRNF